MSHLFRSSRLFRSHYCFHLLLCRCLIKRAVQVCEPDDPTSTILLWLPCGQDRAGCLAHRQEILAHKADSRHMGPCHKSVYGNPSEPWHGSSRQLCGGLCVCVCVCARGNCPALHLLPLLTLLVRGRIRCFTGQACLHHTSTQE